MRDPKNRHCEVRRAVAVQGEPCLPSMDCHASLAMTRYLNDAAIADMPKHLPNRHCEARRAVAVNSSEFGL